MDKIRFLIESSGRKPLLVILASLLLLTTALSEVAPSQPSEADKENIVRQVAQRWIQIGAEQYKRGYFKAAKQSFLRAQDYQGYLTAAEREKLTALIEDITRELLGVEAEPNEVAEQQVVQEPNEVVAAAPEQEAPEPTAVEGAYIEVINRKRNIRRSHTRAVVNDAVAKVQNCVSQDEFDRAKEEVERASRIVNEYQLNLGGELFRQYSGELKQLAEKIAQEQDKRTRQLQEQKRLEAIEAQRRHREQMETERSNRIAELMDNAVAYQSQQRYVEALGQLESLLAIDPLNNQALLLKQTLEDMVSFRRQLEVQRESDRERVSTLVGADEAMIPYAEELTYPKDWREIIAKPSRRPDEPFGRDPANVVVDRQLDEIVDLSQMTPEMPLSEAIEVLKNSVDPPLRTFVNWRDLYDNADIDQTTPINMDPISAVPLRKALELLLEAVSGGFVDINFVVEGGVITIATAESLPSEMETLVYDVTDLIGRPAEFYAPTGAITVSGEGEAGTEELEVEEIDRDELIEEAALRADNLALLIQQTIKPESWYEAGGEGTITPYERKKLIIYQKREVHDQIRRLLEDLRKALGHQVAIEARFLLVGENFLEDIGLDMDFRADVGGRVGLLAFEQDSATIAKSTDTGITGSLAPTMVTELGADIAAMTATGGYGNLLLNDLEVSIILRATQAHRDAQSLTAPKVTVLSGEMASMRVQRVRRYPYEVDIDIEEIGEFGAYRYTIDTEEGYVVSGTLLNITPIITPDKKNVLLNIVADLRDFLGWQPFPVQLPILGAGFVSEDVYEIRYPETEISRVETRVSVPDRATLLLGGQRITTEIERESGVPVLSKVPFLGRLFSNRSKVKDSLILLILVKPTIILREEAEAEAIAAMESNF